ncbi:MAG: phosphatidylglycerophosphatase A [Ignavibacteriota bacterium]|nr:MAG: phosphatidylglycerophosphatase A [Chlorobiota bacterium]MBE7478271.1 phosphatidylglycerophosphatase A [Ignavibacteriales bacterium]MBL1121499.1 phosphatidylglycerophosphatase A [Ignavibacteriota bacterium]MCC7095521.1 phosphatidylglycerophosphatase A [Ignavibacteriaceae bacterium]MCE7855777.1 phosphatidylglycerophosphatase A [Ignavibacteria bacterium CHB3]MEB2295396.1 phosphatidylglycerophosphatase A [Ignavibacteria bacterium]
MKINFFEKFIGSGFYTGYFPIASGTVGSAAAILIYLIPGFENFYIIIPAAILMAVYGIYIGTKFEKKYGKDPAQCTIDEVVGTWISLIALPKTFWVILVSFLLWRILDIIKPPPARNLERLNGGLGIMIDDVVSGIYTLLIMHLVVYLLVIF